MADRRRCVLDALDDEFARVVAIAVRAGLPTRSQTEHPAETCNPLVRLGLAEKKDGRRCRWRRLNPVET
jgi:hypothetical protein